MRTLALLLFLSACFSSVRAQDSTLSRLLRYPDVSQTQIVFVYAGDLWIVAREGGTARRLTSGPGEELFPRFSPDGQSIAFTGQYSGTRQVYVMPAAGGEPRQLTFYNDVGELPARGGVDNQVMGWTPDGMAVLFNAHRLPWSPRMTRPYTVPVAGGPETPLAVPQGGTGQLSPDGTKYVYTPVAREFRTWKRYRGGRNSDLWVYDLRADTSAPIVETPYTDHLPAWVGETIYYAADSWGGKLNLWAYDTRTQQSRQVTNHPDFDVLWPSAGPDAVVYEQGGYVHRFDVSTGQSARVPIRVLGDFAGTLPFYDAVGDNISSYAVSPTGARALFSARGDLFTVPAKEGEPRNLTNTQGVRERDAQWSPDGMWVAYLSDRTGEYELYVRRQDGTGEARQLTDGLDAWTLTPVWSPDSKKLAFGDKAQRLRWVDVATGQITKADRSTLSDITTYAWSPDSRWIAYTKPAESRYSSVWVYSLATGQTTMLTSGLTDDNDPVWDPQGRYLYFTSNRDFNLTFSNFEFNYVYTNPTRVYVGILAQDGPALFLPTSDEEEAPKENPGEEEKPKKGKKKKEEVPPTPQVKIDAEGFERRVRAVPGPSASYFNLAATDHGVLYATAAPGAAPRVEHYNVDEKKKQTILEGVGNFVLSADRKTLLFRRGNDYGIAPLKPDQKATDGTLALDKLKMRVNPRAEWQQIYREAWRILRDWFYDPGMHGTDWEAVRDRYAPLVAHAGSRADLDYILSELAGELNAGHVYVQPGEARSAVARPNSGLLGADLRPDPSGYYQIAKIFPGENWHEDFRSPLTEPGVDVRAGEYILAVDGRSTRDVQNFYELLEAKGDRVVTLTVNDRPDLRGAREERVRPVSGETNLRYLDWVLSRRRMVDSLSGGRVGYIHLPNTAVEGNRELFKYFYPQANKEALLIDDRYNGGGFIPDRMIELLNRPVLNYWKRRGTELYSTPNFSHSGPKAVLINGYSSSGGDAFPYYFRKRELGPLIGTRTWGGLIGISGNPGLVDGGSVTPPTFRFLDTEGNWAVEGVGVEPDIEVVDRPEALSQGRDPSLERGVSYLLEALRKKPARPVTAPPVRVER